MELAKLMQEKINIMTELFYQQNTNAYQYLNVILEGLTQLINLLVQYQAENNEKILDEQELLQSITEAFTAMQEGDNVLLADLFSYNIKEQLQTLIDCENK
ncbi:hypothetical protein SAMN05661086_00359 [Anaeromicropila populeti]|uniref:Uncharacterized protein n=1 Tax=Anaeromicropila populeti TaxID=37658 RepID=A0A1I6HWR8_9FIRM|nr:hypothetical protein SAMN05661086_00359 [Anaeromicropila populeti]